jgi:hypothetical protein
VIVAVLRQHLGWEDVVEDGPELFGVTSSIEMRII